MSWLETKMAQQNQPLVVHTASLSAHFQSVLTCAPQDVTQSMGLTSNHPHRPCRWGSIVVAPSTPCGSTVLAQQALHSWHLEVLQGGGAEVLAFMP